jgi:5-formyltetrahydrofolate cyclo-ligase
MAEDATFPDAAESRAALRRELKQRRHALDARTRIAAAEQLAAQLAAVPAMSRPGYLGGYWAVGGEMSLHAVMPRLADGIVYCLPRLTRGKTLEFAPWRPGDPLAANRFGIPEPDLEPTSFMSAEHLSAVLVPLLGFDRQGNRLGMGGGYYDRSFAFRQAGASTPLMIGIAFACQEVDILPRQAWDVPLDLIATERELIVCQR